MTDAAPDIAPPLPTTPPTKGPNKIGLVALILAGVGFLLAVIPATSGFAWLLLIPAIVLGIIGLTRKDQKKGTALAGLLVGVVGLIVGFIVATVTVLSAVGTAIDEADAPPSSATQPDETDAEDETPSEDAPEAEQEAGIGDVVTTAEGVAFTVSAITCGIPTAGPEFLVETANGQFCEVRFTLDNGSNAAVSVFSSDFTAFIGEAEYEANTTASTVGGEIFSADVNPGLSTEGVVYIDIPVDAVLEYVKYQPLFSFDEGVIVRAS